MMTPHPTHTLTASLSLLLGTSPALASAPDAHTRELIGHLDSDSWLERDLATIELGELDPEITLTDLETFLADPGLSPEQRARLTTACTHRFLDHPKGAMGVSFGTIQIGAIEVQPINDDNFPASKMLIPGDRIAMVDAQMIEGAFELRAQILSRDSGEVMPVTILRHDADTNTDRLIDLDLPLGSFDNLSGASRLDPALVRRALELRWQRKGITPAPPATIATGIDLDAWSAAAFPPDLAPDPRTPDRRTPTVLIVGADQPVQTGYGYTPPPIRPWTTAAQIIQNAGVIATKVRAEQTQVLVARRLLLSQLQRQLTNDLQAGTPDPQATQARLDAVTEKLNTLNAQIESDPGTGP